MFSEGKVKSYHQDRGFGFIEIENDDRDLFFHIKDFPNRQVEPQIGESLKFRIAEEFGKRKAVYIVRADYSDSELDAIDVMHEEYHQYKSREPRESKGYLGKIITIIGLVIIVVLGYKVYEKYQTYQLNQQAKVEQLKEEQLQATEKIKEGLSHLPDIVPLPEKEERRVQSVYIERQKAVEKNQSFSCDGRTHCSQMRSYEEAVYFLRHCPNVKMDGNNDGVPCERQFGR
ncbi:cold shock domain-containing protein [Acinetobacter portensis]|uniref:Cold shock domain-containing protein n=1 Tax=Acinetobacter portensis TaxID=1839785 RepID=A0ABY4JZW8_9GAMM|nr:MULTISPECIES: cold shock domain-containing protein [Acinetobacter]MCK7608196.1 cold shock domain-containing protein [Acinetobacter portensis]MCK7639007.1 cold shock domain-containing protein [Acinetobacter portensis]MDY6460729.1 cold shock domain-containing protein [Acinetobacter faecalis]MDY6467192.1 cold shock domain-containing protein [Acinetobacter faecalis]MDY6535538.1 cold shock domain-containing protein [Acinetobacter faecalis]